MQDRYRFVTSEWSACDAQCDGGRQYREVKCYDFETEPPLLQSDESKCLASKPESFRECNIEGCPSNIHFPL